MIKDSIMIIAHVFPRFFSLQKSTLVVGGLMLLVASWACSPLTNASESPCEQVARKSVWPAGVQSDEHTFLMQTDPRLLFQIPVGLRKITHSGGSIYVRYHDGRLLAFHSYTIDDYSPAKGKIPIVHLPVIFFETKCQSWDKRYPGFLNTRLKNEKRSFMTGDNIVYKVSRKGLVMYFSSKTSVGQSQFAVIVNPDYRWAIQVIRAHRFTNNQFLQILGNIRKY
jgi:hypothetical protein